LHKKLTSVFLTLGLVAGMLVVLSAPALATHTESNSTASLMPAQLADKDQLSDAFDGTDSLAHLTAIADADATQATWYVCTAGNDPYNNPTECDLIGTDSSATVPAPEATHATIESAAAFDIKWNIPATLDTDATGELYDIYVESCTGAPGPQTTAPATNCSDDAVVNVYLDDGAGAEGAGQPAGSGPQLPTGEITGVCNEVIGGATPAATDPCGAPGAFNGTGSHGSTVPADGFTVRFTTSADVITAGACLDYGAGADLSGVTPNTEAVSGPDGCDDLANAVYQGTTSNNNTPTNPNDYFTVWYATFDGTTNVDEDADLAIYGDGDDDNGQCGAGFQASATTCVFDEHYVVTQKRFAQNIVGSFLSATDSGCDNPDAAETNRLDNDESWIFCVTDQFGGPFNGEDVTVEMTGVGTLSCDWGTDQSAATPSNGETQSCTDSSGFWSGDGEITGDISNDDTATPPAAGQREDTTGDSVLVACFNDEAATASTYGCSDEAAADTSNTLTKTWVGNPDHVHLVYAGTGDAADPCHTGDTFKTNSIGDHETLIACVFDDEDNLVTTQNAGNSEEDERSSNTTSGAFGVDLTWDIDNPDNVAFATQAPTETTQTGTATVEIQAIAKGTTDVNVELYSDYTGNWSDAAVTKSVVGEGTAQPQCNDGLDNDGDGKIDHPNDPGCVDIQDNSENSEQPPPTETTHERGIQITRFRHVDIPGAKKPALLVKGKVTSLDGFTPCMQDVPVKVQIYAGGIWITRKTDTTNDNGGWKVLIRDVAARYRARATKFQIQDTANNKVETCLRATDRRRHRHHRR